MLRTGLANHLAYVQHLDSRDGQNPGQMSRPSQMVSRCWVKCCLNAVTSIMPMSSARMLSSYHVARMDLNMAMDHAQLCCEDPTAAVQDSMAISLYMVPAGMSARLFQT